MQNNTQSMSIEEMANNQFAGRMGALIAEAEHRAAIASSQAAYLQQELNKAQARIAELESKPSDPDVETDDKPEKEGAA